MRCIKSKAIRTITTSYEIKHEITGKVYQIPLSKAHHPKPSTKPKNHRIEELNIYICIIWNKIQNNMQGKNTKYTKIMSKPHQHKSYCGKLEGGLNSLPVLI